MAAVTAGAFELFVDYETVNSSCVKTKSVLDVDGDDLHIDTSFQASKLLPTRGPKVRFVVEPVLFVGGKLLPMEGISQQTVLTRCLGPLWHWDAALAETIACGYNSVHFTPVQQLGESGSAYSIYDQLQLAADIFKGQPDVEDAIESGRSTDEIERLKVALLRTKIQELDSR